ncbi:MAG: hypothetical protein ACRDUA_11875 [Micromonosporaceae bacterium]
MGLELLHQGHHVEQRRLALRRVPALLVLPDHSDHGAADNDPPGSTAIAYPRVHRRAGGTKTYAEAITFATNYHATDPPGTRIYVPRLAKYFVMEDDCRCDQPINHVDLWAGGVGTDRGVLACEDG